MIPLNESVAENLDGIGSRDHSVTAEYRIFGPPGTGKTTNLARQVRRAVDRFGEGSVLVTSFSRATAAELADRDLPMSADRIGTLHSICYHALGRPEIAEVRAQEWNHENPALAITPASKYVKLDGEDSGEDGEQNPHDGNRLLQQLNRCRGTMSPREKWPTDVRDFAVRWSRYKAANGLLDFCDLIEVTLRDCRSAPGNPAVIVADEAQDLNRMQLALIRQWGSEARYLLLAGDDDQTIYEWAGASSAAILDPDIPDDHKIFLRQSQRVPRAVHRVIEKLIRQVTRREEKIYRPRPADGAVHRLSSGGYRSPEYWILKSVTQHLAAGKTIMLLASCSYMLSPLTTVLRNDGIPFHNPYRKSSGYWNALRIGSRKSAASRLFSLLVAHPSLSDHRTWTQRDVTLWSEWLRDGVLRGNARQVLATLPATREITKELLQELLVPNALESLLAALDGPFSQLLDWWRKHLGSGFQSRIQFPAEVASIYGPCALQRTPQVVVGTIHSVKGGQADVVYLFPDVSRACDERYLQHGPARDSVIRTFYVGASRARETLYICAPESAFAVSI